MTRRSNHPANCPRRAWGLCIPIMAAVLAMLAAEPRALAQPAPPPPAVTVASIVVKDVAPVYSFIGRVIAIQSVDVVPRVTAFIDDVPVKQGSDVKAGQVLFQLQKSQYEAELEAAKAALKNSQVAYERSARLNQQGFEARAKLDEAIATRDQDQASVQTAQAKI